MPPPRCGGRELTPAAPEERSRRSRPSSAPTCRASSRRGWRSAPAPGERVAAARAARPARVRRRAASRTRSRPPRSTARPTGSGCRARRASSPSATPSSRRAPSRRAARRRAGRQRSRAGGRRRCARRSAARSRPRARPAPTMPSCVARVRPSLGLFWGADAARARAAAATRLRVDPRYPARRRPRRRSTRRRSDCREFARSARRRRTSSTSRFGTIRRRSDEQPVDHLPRRRCAWACSGSGRFCALVVAPAITAYRRPLRAGRRRDPVALRARRAVGRRDRRSAR